MGSIAALFTGSRGNVTQTAAPAGPSGVGGAAQAVIPAGGAGTVTVITGWTITWDSTGVGTVSDEVFVVAGGITLRYKFTTIAGFSSQIGDTYPGGVVCTTANTAVTVGISATPSRASVDIVAQGYSRPLP